METRRGKSRMTPGLARADVAFRAWFDEKRAQLLPLARKIVESGETHVPVLFAFPALGEVAIRQLDYSGRTREEHQRKKSIAFAYMRAVALQPLVRGVIVASEAWDAVMPASAKVPREGIEHLEGRGEVILFMALARSGDDLMQLDATHRITRDPSRLADVADKIVDPYETLSHGRMIHDGKRH